MAESPKENSSSIDLLASIATTVINIEGSIPSSGDASGENIKCKLDRGDSPEYCNSPKCVQFVTQPPLDQGEDNVIDIVDDIYSSNTNSNAVHYHKSDESAGSLVSNNSPRFTHRGGPHSSEHSGSESSSNSPRFTHRGGPNPCKLFLNDTSEEHYNGNWLYIDPAQLQSSENVCVVNRVILFKVLYYVLAKHDSKVGYTTRSGKTSHATFERMLFAMDLNARKGMNVGVFLLGKKQNAEIFTYFLNQRDTSAFGKNYIHASLLFLLQSKSNHMYC
jgi:hypothetical protein